MKNYWLLMFGFIILLGGIIYFTHHHKRWLKELYLTFITKDLVFNYRQIDSSINYRLFVPKNDNSKKLPIVLYLHGAAQRGSENRKQLDNTFYKFTSKSNQKKYPSFVLAPQYPMKTNWINHTDKSVPYGHYNQDDLTETDEIKLVVELVKEIVVNYPIDESRIYITGFSMGATAVWDIITRYPNIFAAALPMSGETDTTKASLITHLPVWAFHGEEDKIVPHTVNKNMIESINRSGGKAKFTKFKGIGHGCAHETLNNQSTLVWLYNQQKSISVKPNTN